ncbi:hypothetical protein LTR66_016790 [Elasticomyces elasticus]|nr:hypothetical protein LTR66_016790 [Elasticomyces elasticus]
MPDEVKVIYYDEDDVDATSRQEPEEYVLGVNAGIAIPVAFPPTWHLRPGACVYTGVTDGRHQYFFLISQNGLQGTQRPTHYLVLKNTVPGMDVCGVAEATYQLCYLFPRCSMSVGLVTPAYFADKACDRARCYVRELYTGNRSTDVYAGQDMVLEVHDHARDRMYYI